MMPYLPKNQSFRWHFWSIPEWLLTILVLVIEPRPILLGEDSRFKKFSSLNLRVLALRDRKFNTKWLSSEGSWGKVLKKKPGFSRGWTWGSDEAMRTPGPHVVSQCGPKIMALQGTSWLRASYWDSWGFQHRGLRSYCPQPVWSKDTIVGPSRLYCACQSSMSRYLFINIFILLVLTL